MGHWHLWLKVDQSVEVSFLHYYTCAGLGPAYGGDEFLRLKEIPPSMVAARSSGSLTLTCSVTGSPTPNTAWYKDGKRISGTEVVKNV